jgi:hypothetical protein
LHILQIVCPGYFGKGGQNVFFFYPAEINNVKAEGVTKAGVKVHGCCFSVGVF